MAEHFAGMLAQEGPVRGLIGPREVERLWERHLLNCAALAEEVPRGIHLADVGSGAGLPGLVIALARPDLRVTLIEPMLRRVTWLDEVIEALDLAPRVRVVRGRADALHGRQAFEAVTARAVAALPLLLEWCLPLVAEGGALLAMKGSRAEEEVADAASLLAERELAASVVEVGRGCLLDPTYVVRVVARA
ncbi:MAG: 16S rRNA (guanine(527)-N(7))-methyltransferase RsmG [Kineosporiaceae bacterium]